MRRRVGRWGRSFKDRGENCHTSTRLSTRHAWRRAPHALAAGSQRPTWELCVDGSAKGNKKAGEYSEEDTHRPAHHYREVVARRTVGQVTGQSAIVTLEKETP